VLVDARQLDLVALDEALAELERSSSCRGSGCAAPGAFGYLLSSDDQGDTYPFGSSQGRLCLGGAIGRHVGPGEVQRADTWGSLAFTVDLTAVPTPFSYIVLQPGDTWNFQVWYRDANPAPISNFTVAVSILFQ
jgi:hypothetical protein